MNRQLSSILLGALFYLLLSALSGVLNAMGGMLSTVGFVFNFAAPFVSAAITVWHAMDTGGPLRGTRAAGLGASAVVAGAVATYLMTHTLVALHLMPDPTELALSQMSHMPPDQRQMARETVAFLNEPMGLLLSVSIGAVFGGIGGVVTLKIFGLSFQPTEPASE